MKKVFVMMIVVFFSLLSIFQGVHVCPHPPHGEGFTSTAATIEDYAASTIAPSNDNNYVICVPIMSSHHK